MQQRELKVMLMGAGGNMRNAHLPRMQRDGAVRIVAVADPVESQARLLMDKAGVEIPYAADWRAMLDQTVADAVLISTPHRDHFEQAHACLERGLHVLVEKPMVIAAGPCPPVARTRRCTRSRARRGLPAPLDAAFRSRPRVGQDRRAGRDSRRCRLCHPALDRRGWLAPRPRTSRRGDVHGHRQPPRRVPAVGHRSRPHKRVRDIRQRGVRCRRQRSS